MLLGSNFFKFLRILIYLLWKIEIILDRSELILPISRYNGYNIIVYIRGGMYKDFIIKKLY